MIRSISLEFHAGYQESANRWAKKGVSIPAIYSTLRGPEDLLADSHAIRYDSAVGFYYRKSARLGPFRVNLSKSGIGYSVGGRGFRTGVSARGRGYTTFSLPGTGIGYRTGGQRSGCLLWLTAGAGLAAGGIAGLLRSKGVI